MKFKGGKWEGSATEVPVKLETLGRPPILPHFWFSFPSLLLLLVDNFDNHHGFFVQGKDIVDVHLPPVDHLEVSQVVPPSTSSIFRTQRGRQLLATDRPPHQQPLPPSFAASGNRAAAPGTGVRGSTSRQCPCIHTNSGYRPRGWTAGATSGSNSVFPQRSFLLSSEHILRRLPPGKHSGSKSKSSEPT